MKDNFFLDTLKQSTAMRLFLFLVILLISSLIGLAVSSVLLYKFDANIKIGQGISSIMMFVVPPIVYYFLTRKGNPMYALGFRQVARPCFLLLLIGVALMFISLPVTNQLTVWNEKLSLGGAFTRLEEWMKTMEETAAETTERMLNVNTFGGLILNLIVIALIPAVGEELTFRGVLQQSLTRGLKNPHVAIILSAAIFSFIHFQFYGFLPRMFLGILLGYMFYISGSLWMSILMHFLNNGTAVVLYYLNNRGTINVDVEHFGAMQNVWLIVASAVLTAALIVLGWRRRETNLT